MRSDMRTIFIEEILPEKRHDISIEKDLEKGFDYRKIIIRELD